MFASVTSGAIAVFWQDYGKGSVREPARGAKKHQSVFERSGYRFA
jgi:hypothetical protein